MSGQSNVDRPRIAGFGHFIFWEGGSLYIGSSVSPSEFHSHHALQVSLGLTGTVQFKTEADTDWVDYEGAVIPSDLPHTFQAPGRALAHLFCEPESVVGRKIMRRISSPEIARLDAMEARGLAGPLLLAYQNAAPRDEMVMLARRTIAALAGDVEPARTVDPRVRVAIREIHRRLDEPITLGDIAEAAGLSEGRFRHLFVAETGVSFRAFVLWARLNRALSLGYGGASWTDAAHAANFADSAHLTRTCRRMFGIAPTSIRDSGAQVSGVSTA